MEDVNSSSIRNALNCPKLQKFWETCSIDERRLISSVERVAVVKKMKERFKHRCDCHNCRKGRIYFEDRARFVDEIVDRLELGGKQIALFGDACYKQILYKSSAHSNTMAITETKLGINCEDKESGICIVPELPIPKSTDSASDEDDCASNVFIFDDMLYIHQGYLYLRDSLLKKKNAFGLVGNRLEQCHLQWLVHETAKPCRFCETIRMFETTVCILMEEKAHTRLREKEAEEKASKVLGELLKEASKNKQRKKKKKTKYVRKILQKSATVIPTDEQQMESISESEIEELQSQDLQKENPLELSTPETEMDSWDGVATKKGVKLFKKKPQMELPLQTEHIHEIQSCQHTPCTPQWNEFSYFCIHQEMSDGKYQATFACYGNCFALPTLFAVPPFLYQ